MKKVVSYVIMALVFVSTFVSCRSEVVKIGAVIPSSTGLGKSMEAGLKLAEKELNRNSGVNYKMVIEDAATENDVSRAYDRLRHIKGVRIFVTTGSAYSAKMKANVLANGDLLFCVASDPAITAEGFWGVYKIGNSSVDESDFIIDYLNGTVSGDNVAVFYPNTAYGIPFKETLCGRLEGSVPAVYEEGAFQQYDGMISKVLSSGPEKIVAIGFSPSLGILIKKLREAGFGGEIISNAGFADSDVKAAAGSAAKDVLYIDYDFEMSPRTEERNEAVRKQYGFDFSSISFLAYSIPYLIDAGLGDDLAAKAPSGRNVNDKLDEDLLHITSDKIRSLKTLKVADEYPYILFENGDVKPSLILRRHE